MPWLDGGSPGPTGTVVGACPRHVPEGIGVPPPPRPSPAVPTHPPWPKAPSSCDNRSCQAEPATVPPGHRATVSLCHHATASPHHRVTASPLSPCHRSTVSPVPEALSRHGASHRPNGKRGHVRWEPAAGGVVPHPAVPHPGPGPPPPRESAWGRGWGVGWGVVGGLIFSTHIEARMRESRAVCISDPPASGQQGSGAAAPLPLREASLARVVSGLGAAPADGANNSVFLSFFFCFFVFWCIAGVGGKVLLGWVVVLFVFFFPF